MKNPVMIFPDAIEALNALKGATAHGGVPAKTLGLVELRASQINGCTVCVDLHFRFMEKAGETDERSHLVAAWRHAREFTPAERAALALSEALTRLADREDPVPDAIWHEAARYYDERGLGALVLAIANINVWNRINVAVGQIAGDWKP